jgi:hypothetical protein
MNRLDDLRQVMPARIAEANASPPVELCILDCNSTDGLRDYMEELIEIARFVPGSSIVYKLIEGRNYWHMAKGKNMATLMGKGEYLITMNADDAPQPGFINAIRDAVDHDYVWGYVDRLCSTIFYHSVDFVAAGGYDERFELYGPEDRDLQHRLRLLYGFERVLPNHLLRNIYTPDDKKVANYRIEGNKHSMHKLMNPYYLENTRNGVLVANKGKEWGNWTN